MEGDRGDPVSGAWGLIGSGLGQNEPCSRLKALLEMASVSFSVLLLICVSV